MSVIERGVSGVRKAGGLMLPMFARPGDFAGLGPGARLALRLLAFAVTLAILAGVNRALELNVHLEPPRGLDSLGHVWLPLLFLLSSAFCWLVARLWGLLGPDRVESSFPDIERAWREAVQALDGAGIGLDESPLFLVVGRSQGPERALFDGAELPLKVRGQPGRDDAPLRVYASREAIYVTCAAASALGRQASILGSLEFESSEPAAHPAGETGAQFGTFGPAGLGLGLEGQAAIIARAVQAGRGPDQFLEEELRALGRLAADRDDAPDGPGAPAWAGALGDKAEVELQGERLRHLGRLIAHHRRPYCPINGILLLVPFAATNSDYSASRIGQICRRDLDAIRDSMQVRCPVFALVCDLENLPGFRELIERLPDDQKRRRMGQRFPFMPDIEPSAIPGVLEGGVRWIAHKQLPSRVASLWRVEDGGGSTATEAIRGNIRLYQLLRRIREREARLGRILSRTVMADGLPSAMLGGCYLAGTGRDPGTEQAFIPGVFRRLIESQDFVSWTPELVDREARYGRWARIGYIALALLAALGAGLIVSTAYIAR